MTRPKAIVPILLCVALAASPLACGTTQPAQHASATTQGSTSIFADIRVNNAVEVQNVHASIDGEDVGGLTGDKLGQRREPIHVATTQLAEGQHSLTIHARAADRSNVRTLVLSVSQVFNVGREPVSLVARLSAGSANQKEPRLHVDFAVEGGTLEGVVTAKAGPSSCHALLPDATEICVTEAMLREAIAEHDAPRVVCLDESLARMRELMRFNADSKHLANMASRHEQAVGRDLSLRIAELATQARHCPSIKATVFLDLPHDT